VGDLVLVFVHLLFPVTETEHTKNSSLLHAAGGKMSTGQNVVTLCGWGVKAGMVHSTCGQRCGWQIKLCDPKLTHAIPKRFRGEFLMIIRYTILFALLSPFRWKKTRNMQTNIQQEIEEKHKSNTYLTLNRLMLLHATTHLKLHICHY